MYLCSYTGAIARYLSIDAGHECTRECTQCSHKDSRALVRHEKVHPDLTNRYTYRKASLPSIMVRNWPAAPLLAHAALTGRPGWCGLCEASEMGPCDLCVTTRNACPVVYGFPCVFVSRLGPLIRDLRLLWLSWRHKLVGSKYRRHAVSATGLRSVKKDTNPQNRFLSLFIRL